MPPRTVVVMMRNLMSTMSLSLHAVRTGGVGRDHGQEGTNQQAWDVANVMVECPKPYIPRVYGREQEKPTRGKTHRGCGIHSGL